MPTLLRVLARIRRRLLIHRRGLAALCLGAAVWVALGVVHPPPPATVTLWTAAHDLGSGTRLTPGDLRARRFPAGLVPDGALRARDPLPGRTLATPLGRGQVVTAAELLGPEHLRGYPGRSALGLRVPDEEAASLLRAGDRVDLIASDPQQGHPPELLAHDAAVLAVPPAATGTATPTGTGRLVVFAVPTDDVEHVASAGSSLYLSVVWNR
jgi:pilus assembly protein CpaB